MTQDDRYNLRDDIFNRCTKVIVDLLSISHDRNFVQLPKITPDTNFIDDLGLDSIELMDLTSAVSNEFKVNAKEEMINFKKVGDLVDYIFEIKSKD